MQLPAGLAHTNLPGSGEKTQTMPEKQVSLVTDGPSLKSEQPQVWVRPPTPGYLPGVSTSPQLCSLGRLPGYGHNLPAPRAGCSVEAKENAEDAHRGASPA
jgi:hypothetical protein